MSSPQARVYGFGGCAPVFMQLETAHASFNLLSEGTWLAVIAFAGDAKVQRQSVASLQHVADQAGTGGARCGIRASAIGKVTLAVPESCTQIAHLGPVPPPSIVVTPEAIDSYACCGQMK